MNKKYIPIFFVFTLILGARCAPPASNPSDGQRTEISQNTEAKGEPSIKQEFSNIEKNDKNEAIIHHDGGNQKEPSPLDQSITKEAKIAEKSSVDAIPVDETVPKPDLPPTNPSKDPPAGNPDGKCKIPNNAGLESTKNPRTVVGNGSPASCTAAAFVAAVAKGGVITFDCGPKPITITLTKTAKVFNNTGAKIVIDGGGKVTLSGGGKVRILYQNTCDKAQKWTTNHCQNQDHPQLTIQNLTFIKGNAKGEKTYKGGGAIFVRGGRLKVVNSRFFNNVCDDTGPDVGGAAIRTLSQYNNLPVYITNCTFGGKKGLGNVCSNGGGLSSIGVSYTVTNSLFSHNKAIGRGANPAKKGTPGGGSGGGIYNDGNTFTLTLCGVKMTENTANEGGGAIFFVSNNRTGSLIIKDSVLLNNPSGRFETKGYPGIFVLAKGAPKVTNSTIK